jgi:hypothetical protein
MLHTSIILSSLASLAVVVALYYSNGLDSLYSPARQPDVAAQQPGDAIPFATRAYWMRRANSVLAELSPSPCPFGAFGSVIVNHTESQGLGELVCIGLNYVLEEGNPTGHGIASGTRRDAADAGEQVKLLLSTTAPQS